MKSKREDPLNMYSVLGRSLVLDGYAKFEVNLWILFWSTMIGEIRLGGDRMASILSMVFEVIAGVLFIARRTSAGGNFLDKKWLCLLVSWGNGGGYFSLLNNREFFWRLRWPFLCINKFPGRNRRRHWRIILSSCEMKKEPSHEVLHHPEIAST